MALLTRDGVELMTLKEFYFQGNVSCRLGHCYGGKAGFDHFMLKEIYDQPKAYRDTMGSRIATDGRKVTLNELSITAEAIRKINRVHIVACGTAYHAGMVGKYVIEKMARIPVETDVASEYRYRSPIITKDTLVIVVSQSGETADTSSSTS